MDPVRFPHEAAVAIVAAVAAAAIEDRVQAIAATILDTIARTMEIVAADIVAVQEAATLIRSVRAAGQDIQRTTVRRIASHRIAAMNVDLHTVGTFREAATIHPTVNDPVMRVVAQDVSLAIQHQITAIATSRTTPAPAAAHHIAETVA